MYSIELKSPSIIKSVEMINVADLFPHENVIIDRKNALKDYIKSYKKYVVIPSIICCYQTGLIIDGHHRYHTLLELGASHVPVTKIDYSDQSVRTHQDITKALNKKHIQTAAMTKELLAPKSTIHEIQNTKSEWKPIILISSLCEFTLESKIKVNF